MLTVVVGPIDTQDLRMTYTLRLWLPIVLIAVALWSTNETFAQQDAGEFREGAAGFGKPVPFGEPVPLVPTGKVHPPANSDWDRVINKGIGGAIVGGVFGAIVVVLALFRKRNVRRNQEGSSMVEGQAPDEAPTDKSKLLIVLIVLGVLMGIVPPWEHTYSRPGAALSAQSAGYEFLLTPPKPKCHWRRCGVRIDVARMAIQWIALGMVFGGVVILGKWEKQKLAS